MSHGRHLGSCPSGLSSDAAAEAKSRLTSRLPSRDQDPLTDRMNSEGVCNQTFGKAGLGGPKGDGAPSLVGRKQAPRVQEDGGGCGQVAGGQELALDQLQRLEACRESVVRPEPPAGAPSGPCPLRRASTPPSPHLLGLSIPPRRHPLPWSSGGRGKGAPGHPATQATLEKPEMPDTPPLSSPRSHTSAPAFGVPAADTEDREEQPLP